ncbi:hypothetical protein B0H11DRAFT_2184823 [Mycena galericulata]|nr:hypothetical protein B0H11DRAFT_2184823 [Mycena galericulata]
MNWFFGEQQVATIDTEAGPAVVSADQIRLAGLPPECIDPMCPGKGPKAEKANFRLYSYSGGGPGAVLYSYLSPTPRRDPGVDYSIVVIRVVFLARTAAPLPDSRPCGAVEGRVVQSAVEREEVSKKNLRGRSRDNLQVVPNVLVEHSTGCMEEDNGIAKITACMKELWREAFRVGYNCGLEFAKGMCRQEDHLPRAAVAKEMEAERVWGYDVGWKLRSEVLQNRTQKASTIPSSTPSRSLAVAATQTEPLVVPNTPLDWAEDAEVLPISTLHPPLPPSSPRDFSALSTGTSRPFASLQRRRRRSPRISTSSHQPHSNHSRHTKSTVYHH